MNTRTAALAAATVATLTLFAGCSDEPTPGVAEQAATPSPSTADPRPTEGTRPTGFTPLSEAGEGVLRAGRYGLTVAEDVDPSLPLAVVDVPAGFSPFGTWILTDDGPRGGGSLGYWTLHAVRRDPCATGGDVVATAAEAAAALRRQARSAVSEPRPVTLAGRRGVYVDVQVPDTTSLGCPRYHLWDIDASGGLPYVQGATLEHLWILDVDGEVVVLETREDLRHPARAHQRLTRMVESVEFVPRR